MVTKLRNCSFNQFALVVPRRASDRECTVLGSYEYRMSEKLYFFKNFVYQKLGNKSKFFSTLQRFNMGALRDTADIQAIVHFRPYSHQQVSCNGSKGYNLFRTRCIAIRHRYKLLPSLNKLCYSLQHLVFAFCRSFSPTLDQL